MTRVTKESLAAKIKTLEEVKQHYGFMSIDQEYNLSAYRMLLAAMNATEVITNWSGAEYYTSAVELYNSDGREFGEAISNLAKTLGVEES